MIVNVKRVNLQEWRISFFLHIFVIWRRWSVGINFAFASDRAIQTAVFLCVYTPRKSENLSINYLVWSALQVSWQNKSHIKYVYKVSKYRPFPIVIIILVMYAFSITLFYLFRLLNQSNLLGQPINLHFFPTRSRKIHQEWC